MRRQIIKQKTLITTFVAVAKASKTKGSQEQSKLWGKNNKCRYKSDVNVPLLNKKKNPCFPDWKFPYDGINAQLSSFARLENNTTWNRWGANMRFMFFVHRNYGSKLKVSIQHLFLNTMQSKILNTFPYFFLLRIFVLLQQR